MAEYIDRNYIGKAYIDLCKALSQKSKICPGANEPTVKDVFALVMHAPAADVVEVRHGRWIPEACESVSKRNRLIEYRVYSCSICGRSNGRVKKKYCPNCGARMDKEDEHEVN